MSMCEQKKQIKSNKKMLDCVEKHAARAEKDVGFVARADLEVYGI